MEPWQRDAMQWTDTATVLACAPAGGAWHVRTTPTVLYPEGGGQPADRGMLGGLPVLDVQRVEGEVVVTVPAPLHVGQAAEVVVDGARRFDLMQQHTGQHLLTAVLLHEHGIPTTSFHLDDDHAAIELATDTVDDALRAAVSARVQAVIREARPVTSRVVSRDALAQAGVRSRLLPQGVDGPLRVVSIDGLDDNTCGGTHVRHTGELQALHLLDVSRVGRRGVRLAFVVGGRVLAWADAARRREATLNALLRTHPGEHAEAVQRLVDTARAADREVRALWERVARGEAASRDAADVVDHREPGADLRVLQLFAATFTERFPRAVVVLSSVDAFLVAGPPEVVARVGPAIAAAVGTRGGGANGRYQGRASVDDAAHGRAVDAARASLSGPAA